MPSPEIADGAANAMPATTIDSCFDERTEGKTQVLNNARRNFNDMPQGPVTPRLSGQVESNARTFSFSHNEKNCGHMDRVKERQPEDH